MKSQRRPSDTDSDSDSSARGLHPAQSSARTAEGATRTADEGGGGLGRRGRGRTGHAVQSVVQCGQRMPYIPDQCSTYSVHESRVAYTLLGVFSFRKKHVDFLSIDRNDSESIRFCPQNRRVFEVRHRFDVGMSVYSEIFIVSAPPMH